MNSFYVDSLRYDNNLSPAEQDRNIILATGINKKTAKKLAKQLFARLIEALRNTDNMEDSVFFQNNIATILWLQGIMVWYYTITGISTYEAGGQRELRNELGWMINDSNLVYKKKNMANWFLLEENLLDSQYLFIQKYGQRMKLRDTTQTSWTTEIADIENPSGHRLLCLIYADIISRYLLEMKGYQSKSKQAEASMAVQQIMEPQI